MEIFLTKLATRLVLPLTLGIGIQLAGFIAWRMGKRGWAAGALASGWLLILAISLPGVARPLRGGLERTYLPESIEAIPDASAILLLGGSLGPPLPPRLSADLGSGADRVLHTARLYRAGKAPLVIASGGPMAWRDSGTEGAPSMAFLLEEWGVPRDAIVLEGSARNTRENCLRAKEIVDRRGLSRVLVVTSALHMRRALATCLSAGLDAVPAPTDYGIVDGRGDQPMKWIPDSTALDNTTQVFRELLGFEVYRLRGWITDAGVGDG